MFTLTMADDGSVFKYTFSNDGLIAIQIATHICYSNGHETGENCKLQSHNQKYILKQKPQQQQQKNGFRTEQY